MEVLNCPLLSVNVRVWRFWSFVLLHNWRRYISIIPVTALNVFMFADLYRAWGNIEEVIINAYFAVLYFNAVVSAFRARAKLWGNSDQGLINLRVSVAVSHAAAHADTGVQSGQVRVIPGRCGQRVRGNTSK